MILKYKYKVSKTGTDLKFVAYVTSVSPSCGVTLQCCHAVNNGGPNPCIQRGDGSLTKLNNAFSTMCCKKRKKWGHVSAQIFEYESNSI